MPAWKPEVAFEFIHKMGDEQWEAVHRVQKGVFEAPDLRPFLERVEIDFDFDLATTLVFFNREYWDEDPIFDCGGVPFADIHFDAEKWRQYFRDQMKEKVIRRFAVAVMPLTKASFMTDDEKIDVIRLANIGVERDCGVMFRV